MSIILIVLLHIIAVLYINIKACNSSEFVRCNHSTRHLQERDLRFLSAAMAAVSKTSRTPSRVRDEHSRYAWASISEATCCPSSLVTGFCFDSERSSITLGSVLRSFFVPTSMMGTLGQKWRISGNHLSTTFPRLSGLEMLKQSSTTSVSGYDSGLQPNKIFTV